MMTRFILILTVLLGLATAQPDVQAEVFPLDVGRLGFKPGTMDVARDANFQNIIVSISIGDKKEYLVNLPETAVYYLRVRHQDRVQWQEEIFALLENDPKNRLPRLDWSAVPRAARYRLWLVRSHQSTRWLETPDLAVHLHRLGAPWLIRLRALTAEGEPLPVPGLKFQWASGATKDSESEKSKATDLNVDLSAPDDDQVVYEPTDKELLEGADDGVMDNFIARVTPMNLPPLVRQHEVYVWLRYLREQFSIDKKDRFEAEPSSGLGTGAGGQFFLAPNLAIAGTIDTHATLTDYEAGGTQAPNTLQKRIRLHVGVGLDVLNTHMRTTDWSLFLGPVAGLVQMPLQENEQKFTDYGFRLATQHYPSRSALSVLFLKSGSREIDARWIMPWTAWSIRPFLGVYLYNTRQSAGAVTGLFHESGLRLGLERDF